MESTWIVARIAGIGLSKGARETRVTPKGSGSFLALRGRD
ncbi:hypothetical protein ACPOL_6964 (plasmid) [Acidisarcina polymorpha]|uniref:Uncharacterized protein n=1 Tax=Acidisarcina polymorpha TaxID=2211140 RepID=A0A2Z5GB02_9BACT|nr:hypothetical protein ACPOL_6964 [Acidisarcina polymorpha]